MRWFRQLRHLFRKAKLDADMAEEMRLHVELQAEMNVQAGMSPGEARLAAQREFGNTGVIQQQVREGRSWLWLEQLGQDVQLGIRLLRKTPGFTCVAILTLALGVGPNAAIFSVMNTLILKPLPYPDSERIVMIWELGSAGVPAGGGFIDIQDHSTQLEYVSSSFPGSRNLTGRGDPQQLRVLEVSADYLRVFGVTPVLGRNFVATDESPKGDGRVAILSDEFWRSEFAADPTVVGNTMTLDGQSIMVIGVLPPRALLNRGIQLLVPANIRGVDWKASREYWYACQVIARLKPGVTTEQAAAELTVIKRALKESYPAFRRNYDMNVITLHQQTFGGLTYYLMFILGAVSLVLLIACANLANLLLARASARQGELAIRFALGASRGRVVRQLFTESVILAAVGGATGILLGHWLIPLLVKYGGLGGFGNVPITIDGRVLLFVVIITSATTLLFGLVPAWSAARPNLSQGLKDSGRNATAGLRRHLPASFVVIEIALTVVLLLSTGLLLRSFTAVLKVDAGFEPKNVLAFNLAQAESKAPTPEHRARFATELIEKLDQIPGVVSAAMCSSAPTFGGGYGDLLRREDQPETREKFWPNFDSISGDYFQTLGIPLLRGRYLVATDNSLTAPRAMIVSASVARHLFGDEDPLGRQLNFKKQAFEIVGVVGDVRHDGLESSPNNQIYVPQVFFPVLNPIFVVKTSVPPETVAMAARKAVLAVDPEQPLAASSTLQDSMRDYIRGRIAMLGLLSAFAVLGLLLASVGLYGVMAYTVTQRTREMGIRIALGAGRRQVIGLVLRSGLRLIALGLALGIGGSFGSGRLLANQLYQVAPYDPLVLASVSGVLFVVALLACWLPARRAAKVDPVIALRAE